jgi:hypothetical protein
MMTEICLNVISFGGFHIVTCIQVTRQ